MCIVSYRTYIRTAEMYIRARDLKVEGEKRLHHTPKGRRRLLEAYESSGETQQHKALVYFCFGWVAPHSRYPYTSRFVFRSKLLTFVHPRRAAAVTLFVFFFSSVRPQIEAMVPFAFPNPTPASERRRVRNANGLLFSVMGGRTTDAAKLDRKNGGGSGSDGSNPAAPPITGGRGASASGGRHRSGGGGARAETHVPNLEEQLYAGLGSLLEVSKAAWTVFVRCVHPPPLHLLCGGFRFFGRRGWARRSCPFFWGAF